MCPPSPSAHLLRSSQRAAPSPHKKCASCSKLGDDDGFGLAAPHGFIFVAVFDYVQCRSKK